jgi:hypothetical protein
MKITTKAFVALCCGCGELPFQDIASAGVRLTACALLKTREQAEKFYPGAQIVEVTITHEVPEEMGRVA